MHSVFLKENPEGQDHLGNPCEEGRVILKLIFEK